MKRWLETGVSVGDVVVDDDERRRRFFWVWNCWMILPCPSRGYNQWNLTTLLYTWEARDLVGFWFVALLYCSSGFMLSSRVRVCLFPSGKRPKSLTDSLRIISALKILGFHQSGNHFIIFISTKVPYYSPFSNKKKKKKKIHSSTFINNNNNNNNNKNANKYP